MSAAPREPVTMRAGSQEKLLPQNVDAEASVLGCILIAPEAIAEACELISAQDFYRDAHALIFQAAVDLYEESGPADLIGICDELTRRGQLEEIGGSAYVGSLANTVTNWQSVGRHARIVQRVAVNRNLIHAAGQIAGIAYSDPDAEESLTEAGRQLALIDSRYHSTHRVDDPLRPLSLTEMLERPQPELLIDRMLLSRGVSMYAGDGGCGKSVLLSDLAIHVSLGQPWNGHQVKQGGVLIIAGEGGTGFAWRVKAWLEQHGMTPDDLPDFHIIPHAVQILDPNQRKRAVEYAKELPVPPIWVIVETLSQTSSGSDQNDNALMAAYVRSCREIADALEGHCTFSHHAIKSGEGYRGASALRDDVETVFMVSRAENISTVHCAKQRDGWEELSDFQFTAAQYEPSGSHGLTYGVFEYTGLGSAKPAKPTRLTLPLSKRNVLDAIKQTPGIVRATVVTYCKPIGLSRSSVYDSLNRMITDGWITEDMHGLQLTDECPY